MDLDACVNQALSLVPDGVRTRFAVDPVSVLRDDLNLTVTAIDHLASSRNDDGACDGVSFLQDGVILYAPTPGSRRENFTVAHELGHWLAENATDIYDWVADQDEPGRLLETVCDRVAQHLLLPESVTTAVIADGPIRAKHLVDLYEASQASRPVCAIALAKRLPGLGALAIIDRYTRSVTHASVKPDPDQGWPTVFPWRNQELSESHPLLGLASGETAARRLSWQTPWGARAEFYVDAIGDDNRVMAVFCDRDLWEVEQFHPPIQREFDTRPLLTGSCCGTSFERRGYPCPNCGQPFCPRCDDCRCSRVAKRALTCNECFLEYQAHLIIDGLCVDCRS